MNCAEFERRYLERQAESPTAALPRDAREHLAGCARCGECARQLDRLTATLRAMSRGYVALRAPRVFVPPAASSPPRRRTRVLRIRNAWIGLTAAAAAALVFLVLRSEPVEPITVETPRESLVEHSPPQRSAIADPVPQTVQTAHADAGPEAAVEPAEGLEAALVGAPGLLLAFEEPDAAWPERSVGSTDELESWTPQTLSAPSLSVGLLVTDDMVESLDFWSEFDEDIDVMDMDLRGDRGDGQRDGDVVG